MSRNNHYNRKNIGFSQSYSSSKATLEQSFESTLKSMFKCLYDVGTFRMPEATKRDLSYGKGQSLLNGNSTYHCKLDKSPQLNIPIEFPDISSNYLDAIVSVCQCVFPNVSKDLIESLLDEFNNSEDELGNIIENDFNSSENELGIIYREANGYLSIDIYKFYIAIANAIMRYSPLENLSASYSLVENLINKKYLNPEQTIGFSNCIINKLLEDDLKHIFKEHSLKSKNAEVTKLLIFSSLRPEYIDVYQYKSFGNVLAYSSSDSINIGMDRIHFDPNSGKYVDERSKLIDFLKKLESDSKRIYGVTKKVLPHEIFPLTDKKELTSYYSSNFFQHLAVIADKCNGNNYVDFLRKVIIESNGFIKNLNMLNEDPEAIQNTSIDVFIGAIIDSNYLLAGLSKISKLDEVITKALDVKSCNMFALLVHVAFNGTCSEFIEQLFTFEFLLSIYDFSFVNHINIPKITELLFNGVSSVNDLCTEALKHIHPSLGFRCESIPIIEEIRNKLRTYTCILQCVKEIASRCDRYETFTREDYNDCKYYDLRYGIDDRQMYENVVAIMHDGSLGEHVEEVIKLTQFPLTEFYAEEDLQELSEDIVYDACGWLYLHFRTISGDRYNEDTIDKYYKVLDKFFSTVLMVKSTKILHHITKKLIGALSKELISNIINFKVFGTMYSAIFNDGREPIEYTNDSNTRYCAYRCNNFTKFNRALKAMTFDESSLLIMINFIELLQTVSMDSNPITYKYKKNDDSKRFNGFVLDVLHKDTEYSFELKGLCVQDIPLSTRLIKKCDRKPEFMIPKAYIYYNEAMIRSHMDNCTLPVNFQIADVFKWFKSFTNFAKIKFASNSDSNIKMLRYGNKPTNLSPDIPSYWTKVYENVDKFFIETVYFIKWFNDNLRNKLFTFDACDAILNLSQSIDNFQGATEFVLLSEDYNKIIQNLTVIRIMLLQNSSSFQGLNDKFFKRLAKKIAYGGVMNDKSITIQEYNLFKDITSYGTLKKYKQKQSDDWDYKTYKSFVSFTNSGIVINHVLPEFNNILNFKFPETLQEYHEIIDATMGFVLRLNSEASSIIQGYTPGMGIKLKKLNQILSRILINLLKCEKYVREYYTNGKNFSINGLCAINGAISRALVNNIFKNKRSIGSESVLADLFKNLIMHKESASVKSTDISLSELKWIYNFKSLDNYVTKVWDDVLGLVITHMDATDSMHVSLFLNAFAYASPEKASRFAPENIFNIMKLIMTKTFKRSIINSNNDTFEAYSEDSGVMESIISTITSILLIRLLYKFNGRSSVNVEQLSKSIGPFFMKLTEFLQGIKRSYYDDFISVANTSENKAKLHHNLVWLMFTKVYSIFNTNECNYNYDNVMKNMLQYYQQLRKTPNVVLEYQMNTIFN